MEIRRTNVLGFLLLLVGLVLCYIGLWLLLSPAQYRATARIKVEAETIDIIGLSGPARNPSIFDPSFARIICEDITSEVVFSNVVKTLNLNAEWGEKNAGGGPIKTVDTIRLLRRRVLAYVVPNTLYLIEVRATSKDPDEAAKIANATAKAYLEFRMEQRRQLILRGVEYMQQRYQEDEKQIPMVQTNLDLLREKLKINDDRESDNPTAFIVETKKEAAKEYEQTKPYWEMKRKLATMIEFHKLEKAKIEEEQMALNRPDNPEFSSGVKIVDLAVPPQTPEGPNRLLGAILFAIGLAMTAGKFFLTGFSRRQSA